MYKESANLITCDVKTLDNALDIVALNFGKVTRRPAYFREAGTYIVGTVSFIDEDGFEDDTEITFNAYSNEEQDPDFRCHCGRVHALPCGVLSLVHEGELLCVISVCEHND